MSSAAPPSQRGHCVQVTDNIYYCRCLNFAPHASPLQDQFACATCGHSIHTHVGHLPGFVHRPPVSHYAYVLERTPTTQQRTCMMQLVGHTADLNPHRSPSLNQYLQELFEAGSQPEQGPPPHTNITKPSGDMVKGLVAPAELIASRHPTIPDPYHPTDWAYRMPFFTGSKAPASADSSSEVVPLYAPRATHPHPNINLLPAYTQADTSSSLDDSTQHQEHMVSDSDYGIRQTNAIAENSTVQQDRQSDKSIVQSDDEAHESPY